VRLVTEGLATINAIPDTSALFRLADIALGIQVSDYLSHRPLGNPDTRGKLTRRYHRVVGNKAQHQGVIGQKGPLWHLTPRYFPIFSGKRIDNKEIWCYIIHVIYIIIYNSYNIGSRVLIL
jgi:hypothetical protein